MDEVSEILSEKQDTQQMAEDGVLVFRKQIDLQLIEGMKSEVRIVRDLVAEKIKNMGRPLKTYSDIAERFPGRLDYRCGLTGLVFDKVARPIVQLVKQLSPQIDFRYYWGAIPSAAGSGPTNLHRDIYPLLNTTPGVDMSPLDRDLPPYYFTVLIPLMEITPENGPTQFIKGSLKHLHVDESQATLFSPCLSPGDFVIFDGRTLHRGSANRSQEERVIAYMTFVANWYHDQTFTINEYLFPELSIKGR